MQFRLIRLRFRRRLRKGQRQVEDLGTQAEQQIERHLFKRFNHLVPIRRFVVSWLSLMALLIGVGVAQNLALSDYYQTLRPVPGGIFTEGVLGRFTNANPIYATSEADGSLARLIFAGLLTYDSNGNLVGDLAEGYSVDEVGTTYTVKLRSGLSWHDSQPLTSADVVYTYQLIQNPDARSPLQGAWQSIEILAPDAQTIVFKLPGGLAAFPSSLTTGILPKHRLANVQPADLRAADFNTINPIGAGPFKWQAIELGGAINPKQSQVSIALAPFEAYQAGAPKLQQMVIKFYADKAAMIDAFRHRQLTGMAGLTDMPLDLKHHDNLRQYNLPLRAINMVFFKTSEGVLAEEPVRQALVQSVRVPSIIKDLDYPTRLIRGPILPGQLGYDQALAQADYDPKVANNLLDAAGWAKDKRGWRHKAGQPLTFGLSTADTPEYRHVTQQLKQHWQRLGVQVNIRYLDQADFQNRLNSHDYDSILYGISIGADPDVFVYWDSSQADIRAANRLNFSEYKNPEADAALEAGRTRRDPALRLIKYQPFLQAWQRQNPALALYQPRALYLANESIDGLTERPINSATDRFNNVHNWQINQAKVTNSP